MIGTCGYVRGHDRLRIAVRRSVLNFQTRTRVGIVARPKLREIAQRAEIEPAAAARAAFKEDERELFGKFCGDPVKSKHIAMEVFALRDALGITVGQRTVVIPFDV